MHGMNNIKRHKPSVIVIRNDIRACWYKRCVGGAVLQSSKKRWLSVMVSNALLVFLHLL